MEQEKRKYFIGCVLSNHVALRCKRIAGDLAETFAVKNVFKKYEPHMTWKAPFLADDSQIDDVIKILQKFVEGRRVIPVTMKGFGHFSTGVIYCDIIAHDEKLELVQCELCQALELLPWNITFEKTEPSGIFHVTVANDDIRGRFPVIFEYLKTTHRGGIDFDIDSVDLFEKTDGVWRVIQRFPLMRPPGQ